jgi:uncharacterized protein (TIGR02284 family)
MVISGMRSVDHEFIETLNELISVCEDGKTGYAQASEAVSSSATKAVLQKYELQRSTFAEALRELVSTYGANPDDSGSLLGALHRGFMNIRDALGSAIRDSDVDVLDEVLRGEDKALEAYAEAVNSSLPYDAHRLVCGQYEDIQSAVETIKARKKTLLG